MEIKKEERSMGVGEYAQYVDYSLVHNFRSLEMARLAAETKAFPARRGVIVDDRGDYWVTLDSPYTMRNVIEGPGNKPWIAELFYQETGIALQRFAAWDAIFAAVNDLISSGHMPVILTDDITLNDYGWCNDAKRSASFRHGVLEACEFCGMAITGGETASDKFLVKPHPPVQYGPVLSANVTGILADPKKRVNIENVRPGDSILGTRSTGLHVNGSSIVIARGSQLPDGLMTEVPGTGRTLAEEALTTTRSYVGLVEKLLEEGIDVHGFLPGTGDGLRKILRAGPFKFRIETWTDVPEIFTFLRSLGMTTEDYLTTFNCGIGWYTFTAKSEAARAIGAAASAGYDMLELGIVEKGKHVVVVEPEGGIELPPLIE